MNIGVSLRDVREGDLGIFYEHQLDPEATQMAAFPARDYEAFMDHWHKGMQEATTMLKTIVLDGKVVGNIVSWEQSGERKVGYWLGKDYWGRGIATAALTMFLKHLVERPLHAHAAKHNVASIRVLQKCGFSIVSEGQYEEAEGGTGEEYFLTLVK